MPGGLVEQLPPELPKAHIAKGLGQVVILEHPANMQVFNHQH